MTKFSRLFFYWLPPIAWMSLIFFLSSIPGLPDFGEFDFSLKKGAHFVVYALLYFFLFRAFHSAQPDPRITLRTYVYPAVIAFLFALSDEFHQSFVYMRHGRVRDVVIDMSGVLSMAIAIKTAAPFFKIFLSTGGRKA